MDREQKGWIRQRGQRWYAGLRLRDGTVYERVIKPAPGETVTRADADVTRADMVRAYERGVWDPQAPQKPAPASQTVAEFCASWASELTYESAVEDQRAIARYVARAPLGKHPVQATRPAHILDWLRWLRAQPSQRGGTLAPRTVRNAFDAMRRAFDEAVLRELLDSNPCSAVRGRLPEVEDKVPGARATWAYSISEVEALLAVATPRLALNALRLLTGARTGEVLALRWSDWDRTATPLTRLTLARAIKSRSRTEGSTKTRAVKLVPVHPTLEAILLWWQATGFARVHGRAPEATDLVVPVPGKRTAYRSEIPLNRGFKRDCSAAGVRPLHQHATRHSFITLAQSAGGDGSLLRWVTHAPPRSAFDGYTRVDWQRLCAEVLKLQVRWQVPAETATHGDLSPEGEGEDDVMPANLLTILGRCADSIPVCSRHGAAECPRSDARATESASALASDDLVLRIALAEGLLS